MPDALSVFQQGIVDARKNSLLHDYLSSQVRVPIDFDDVLRAQIVLSVAAFDKLLHDVIRRGMNEIYLGKRPPTPKFLSETITTALHKALVDAVVPPAEYFFDRSVVTSLSHLAFQQPDKVSDGLAKIWNESEKWNKISAEMGCNSKYVQTRLKLIVDRRNAIVHQSDIDPFSGIRTSISKAEAEDVSEFLLKCGEAIHKLVA